MAQILYPRRRLLGVCAPQRRTSVPRLFIPALLLTALLGTLPAAYSDDTFFTHNTTINSAKQYIDWAYVGYAGIGAMQKKKRPTSPTVRLMKGGRVELGLFSFNRSQIIVTGGTVNGDLDAGDSSTVTVSGGTLNNLIGENQSTITLSGGQIDDTVSARDQSLVTVTGGSITGDIDAAESSTVNVRGGSIQNSLIAEGRSTVNVFGTGLSASRVLLAAPSDRIEYTLTGKLADGTILSGLNVDVQESTGARLVLRTPSGGTPPRHTRSILLGVVVAGTGLVVAVAGILTAAVRKKRTKP